MYTVDDSKFKPLRHNTTTTTTPIFLIYTCTLRNCFNGFGADTIISENECWWQFIAWSNASGDALSPYFLSGWELGTVTKQVANGMDHFRIHGFSMIFGFWVPYKEDQFSSKL